MTDRSEPRGGEALPMNASLKTLIDDLAYIDRHRTPEMTSARFDLEVVREVVELARRAPEDGAGASEQATHFRVALVNYGDHKRGCTYSQTFQSPCSCGFHAAIDRFVEEAARRSPGGAGTATPEVPMSERHSWMPLDRGTSHLRMPDGYADCRCGKPYPDSITEDPTAFEERCPAAPLSVVLPRHSEPTPSIWGITMSDASGRYWWTGDGFVADLTKAKVYDNAGAAQHDVDWDNTGGRACPLPAAPGAVVPPLVEVVAKAKSLLSDTTLVSIDADYARLLAQAVIDLFVAQSVAELTGQVKPPADFDTRTLEGPWWTHPIGSPSAVVPPRHREPTPRFVCGPTCGCGNAMEMVRVAGGWQPPKVCPHCGKETFAGGAVIVTEGQ